MNKTMCDLCKICGGQTENMYAAESEQGIWYCEEHKHLCPVIVEYASFRPIRLALRQIKRFVKSL